jgi:ABC-type polysaccharide/polyol phosphate export permease
VFRPIRELHQYRRLIYYLTWGRIRQGERDKVLGRLWSLLNPLALLAIYYFIFNVVFDSRMENFSLFLFSAIIAWRFFSQSVNLSSRIIVANQGLVSQAYFPKSVLPLSVVLTNCHDYLYAFAVLIGITVVLGVPITPFILLWPVVFAVEFVFTLAFALLSAHIGVFFRDLQNILTILFRLGFYLSGTMYDISRVPESIQPYFRLNPIYILYESYRGILLYNRWPSAVHLGVLTVISVFLLWGGLRLMDRSQGNYVKYI